MDSQGAFRRNPSAHLHRVYDCSQKKTLVVWETDVHITEDLTWSAHTDAVLKEAHQRLFFLRRLRKFGTSPSILRSFYSCTVESILNGCITAWFGNSTTGNRKAMQRVVRTACHIVGGERCIRKARRIIKDSRPTVCSLCCPQEDISAAFDSALVD